MNLQNNVNIGLCVSTRARITDPVAVMRQSPDVKSEVVSQALFSEEIRILETSEEWTKIETVVDNYVGWLRGRAYRHIKEPTAETIERPIVTVSRLAAHLYGVKDTIYGPIMTLPYESRLEVNVQSKEHDARWLAVILPDESSAFIQRGDVAENKSPMTLDEVCRLSHCFLGLPYTWGGRSSFGYDCSGFVQMLYRQMGISLPRDAKIQRDWEGFSEVTLDKIQPGNLVFFGPDADRIRHVGFCLGGDEFIHSTVAENMPYIRISRLSELRWNGSGDWPYRSFRGK
jgi:hypothetical protein